jgi:hypothetical protein
VWVTGKDVEVERKQAQRAPCKRVVEVFEKVVFVLSRV